MVTTCGIVQNNESTVELLKQLKTSGAQYSNLDYKTERNLIESASVLERDENGYPVVDHVTKKKHKIILKYKLLDNYDEVREKLIMHHIRRVFNLAKSYSKNTVDFDDLIAKGLYGLSIAAKKFNPYAPVQNKETGEMEYEEDGKTPKYVKFITYSTNWINKYIRQEFYDDKRKKMDENCVSLDMVPRINNSEGSQTLENYVESLATADYEPNQTSAEIEMANTEVKNIYNEIYDYVMSPESNLSAMEQQIFVDTFYNHKRMKDIADELDSNTTTILNKRRKVLGVVKDMLQDKHNINSLGDILV